MFFKNQYYCFVSGLPDISFDSTKLPFTVDEFRETLAEVLKPKDLVVVKRYFLKYDNENLIAFLKDRNATFNALGSIEPQTMADLVEAVKEDARLPKSAAPHYFADYIRAWLDENAENQNRIWEDFMTSFYMDYGMQSRNTLLAKWFELNLNIGNVLAAIYSRKYDQPIADAIVGNNDVAQSIRENVGVRDFGLGLLDFEHFDTLVRLSEETDIYDRERKIDKLRWDWLEENTVFDYFNIEYIFAYLCKLQILERWVSLNAKEGERVFRELIARLKSGVEMPEE